MNVLNRQRPRAYTSVMSLMDTMARKGQLKQKARGKAFVYSAKVFRTRALSGMVGDLVNRAFDGSASSLVTHLLEQSRPSDDELDEIRKIIVDFSGEKGGE
jgi:predicted transcriptional regulator